MRKHASPTGASGVHRLFSMISLPVGGTDLFLSAIHLWALSHSFRAEQGYAKSQDVKVKGLNANSLFSSHPICHRLGTRCGNRGTQKGQRIFGGVVNAPVVGIACEMVSGVIT